MRFDNGSKTVRITADEYAYLTNSSYVGVCLACGAESDGVEPDAEGYACDACGENEVFGLEQALVMGSVVFE